MSGHKKQTKAEKLNITAIKKTAVINQNYSCAVVPG